MSATPEIDDFAKRLCANLGLDPDAPTQTDYFGPRTNAEIAAYRAKSASPGMPLVSVFCPLWKIYRKEAELALAVELTRAQILAEREQNPRGAFGRELAPAELLAVASARALTDEEVRAQRESFARHNVSTGDPRFD